MGPPCGGSERACLTRWLEVTAERIRDLSVMREEAEDRVREAMGEEKGSHRVICSKWQKNADAVTRAATSIKPRKSQETERLRSKNSDLLGHIQEEGSQCYPHLPEMELPQELTIKMTLAGIAEQHAGKPATKERRDRHSLQAFRAEDTWGAAKDTPLSYGATELPQPVEYASLRRIGSGSLAPRLRLGSSGVTSDLLFSKRLNGNCLSTHSSGFYETSDFDSASSSCSSLCSDSSFHTSLSRLSPHRSSAMRPRSIDYTAERRKELQNGRAQQRRPISAGALEGVYLSSISNSRYDIAQSNDRTTRARTYSPPLLGEIKQRIKAERYICKLALKYHCKPGVCNPLPDLGPPTPKILPSSFISSDDHDSCPPSPHIVSLSSSMGDVRKTPKGSWGRFFSRVMLRKDSRTAASELNLQRYGHSPQHSLRSPSLAEGQLTRAKSFRDLLSTNPFKRSQRSLNKLW